MAVAFRILGPVEVMVDGERAAIPAAKRRALLAALLLRPNQPVSTDALIDAVWGEAAPDRADNAVQVYVSQLRKLLGSGRIVTRSPGYLLEVGDGELDVDQFGMLLGAATRHHDPRRRRALLAEALALWRGPALGDLAGEHFFAAEAARLDELRLVAIEDRVEVELDLGGHEAVVPEVEAHLAAHPFRERLRAQLMVALYRSGRQAEAVQTYQKGRQLLIEELGLEPSRELARLEQAILLQEPELDLPGQGAPPPSPAPVQWGPPPSTEPFVGRVEEQARLRAMWERAAQGTTQLVVVTGEAGVGKTRLAAEVARWAMDRGAQGLFAQCDEEVRPPYRPFVDGLRQHARSLTTDELQAHGGALMVDLGRLIPEVRERLPELPVPTGGDADSERYLLFEAVAGYLRVASGSRPIVFMLDDLQWIDRSSLLLLRHLLQASAAPALLVLATCRDTDLDPAGETAMGLADLRRLAGVERLALEGLPRSDVGRLLEVLGRPDLGESADAVHARTDGNPFFVLEIVRHVTEGGGRGGIVPEAIRDVLGLRLRRLGAVATEVLSVAAVVGPEFAPPLVAAAAGVDVDGLSEAIDQGIRSRVITEAGPGRYRFAHDLIRDALYQQLGAGRRLRLHQLVGEAIERATAGAGDESGAELYLADLAHHFGQAAALGTVDKAIAYAWRAADEAMSQLAYENAVAEYRRALELLGSAPTVERCELLLSLGEAEWQAGVSARATFLEAAAVARAHGSGAHLVRAALALGTGPRIYLFEAGEIDQEAIALLEEALALLGPEDSALRVEALGCLAKQLYLGSPWERRLELVESALAMARRLGDPATTAAALSYWHLALWSPHNAEGRLRAATELLALALELGDRSLAMTGRLFRLVDLLELGDLEAADAELAAEVELAERYRMPQQQWHTHLHQVMRATLRGDFDEAERIAIRGLQASPQTELELSVFGGQIAVLRTLQGRASEIPGPARALIAAQPMIGAWRAGLAFALVEAGDLEAAAAEFGAISDREIADPPRDMFWAVYVAAAAEVCAALGDERRAALLHPLVEPVTDHVVVLALGASCWGSMAHYVALLDTTLGRLAEAEKRFETALAANEALGAPPLVARTQAALAALLLRRDEPGDADRAATLLGDAAGIAERFGMLTTAARIAALVLLATSGRPGSD